MSLRLLISGVPVIQSRWSHFNNLAELKIPSSQRHVVIQSKTGSVRIL